MARFQTSSTLYLRDEDFEVTLHKFEVTPGEYHLKVGDGLNSVAFTGTPEQLGVLLDSIDVALDVIEGRHPRPPRRRAAA